MEYCVIDVNHLAAIGDVVLTERVDNHVPRRQHGSYDVPSDGRNRAAQSEDLPIDRLP
jgi:hypothetical protein